MPSKYDPTHSSRKSNKISDTLTGFEREAGHGIQIVSRAVETKEEMVVVGEKNWQVTLKGDLRAAEKKEVIMEDSMRACMIGRPAIAI
eukprot:1555783-Ditylum_brightwellii.AAC.1